MLGTTRGESKHDVPYPLFIVGLTGSMGCGKSTVGAMFAKLGAWMIDTDCVARQVVAPGSDGLQAVVTRFGPSFLENAGTENKPRGLDRKKLGAWVFAHPEDRAELEKILHFRILQEIRNQLIRELNSQDDRSNSTRVVILEVPLLFESGWDRLCDLTVNVACGDQQWQRLAPRENMSDQVKHQVLAQQRPEEEKCRLAHRTIDNSNSEKSTLIQVERLWAECQTLANNYRRHLWPNEFR